MKPLAPHPAVEEPLRESAPLAERLSHEHCHSPGPDGRDCAWYHGFWQYMRLMNIAKTSGGHVDFLMTRLRAAARSGRARVLVSGTGDYSMPAHVLAAYRIEHAPLELHVVDVCGTPVALSHWYAARVGAHMIGHVCDVLGFDDANGYDVVMTNSFLGYFDLAARERLFARWSALVRPGGTLLLTNRIRPGEGHEPVGFTADQAQAFRQTVRAEAERWRGALGWDPAEVATRADRYAARFKSVPVRTSDEVVALARTHGFRIDRADTALAAGRGGPSPVAGPTTAEAADYVRLAAVRE